MPEFGELQVLDHLEGREPVLRAPKTQATVRQLMSHTAGCGYHFLNEKLFAYCAEQHFPNPLEGIKQSISAPLVQDPGTVWEYGVSTDWIGMVAEAVSGQTLANYLAEHVYGPLGMTDSTFDPTDEQRAMGKSGCRGRTRTCCTWNQSSWAGAERRAVCRRSGMEPRIRVAATPTVVHAAARGSR